MYASILMWMGRCYTSSVALLTAVTLKRIHWVDGCVVTAYVVSVFVHRSPRIIWVEILVYHVLLLQNEGLQKV